MPTAALRRLTTATVAIALAIITAACGDPEPDPSTAPIEVVANSLAKPGEACILNRTSVGAGTHELVVIAESAPAQVRVQDSNGEPILDLTVAQGATQSSSVVLEPGAYAVSCAAEGGTPVSSVQLRVED